MFKNLFVPYRRMARLDAVYLTHSHGTGTVDSWVAPTEWLLNSPTRQRVPKNAYTGAQGILNAAGYMLLAESVHELEALTVFYKHLLYSMQGHG